MLQLEENMAFQFNISFGNVSYRANKYTNLLILIQFSGEQTSKFL